MKYIVKTFTDTKDLEEYLNKEEPHIDNVKISINHNLILLVVLVW